MGNEQNVQDNEKVTAMNENVDNDNHNPKFSIIIPAHNAAAYIHKCLKSVDHQVFKDYELTVVCDSCTDDTEQIARAYTDNVITVSFNHDGRTRNAGLDAARGEWILFLDDDDWWLHEYVLEMIDNVIGKNNEDVLFFGFIWKGVGYARQSRERTYYACWNKCYRHDFIRDCRFSDVKYSSDVDFYKAVISKSPRAIFWDMPFYYYNFMRKGSLSRELKDQGVMYEEVDYSKIDLDDEEDGDG